MEYNNNSLCLSNRRLMHFHIKLMNQLIFQETYTNSVPLDYRHNVKGTSQQVKYFMIFKKYSGQICSEVLNLLIHSEQYSKQSSIIT